MKNKKRLTALLLATVLVCSQVSTIGSPVTAEETELTTEAAQAVEAVSEESEAATGETVSASAETADNDAETPDADSTDAEESADVTEAVTEGMTEAVTESSTEDVAEGTADGSTEAATEAVSEAERESEDETETEIIEDVNAGISLAGLDLDGSVSVVDEEDEGDEGDDEESESWWIDVDWQNSTNCLLVGETVSEVVYLQHHYYYEEEEDGWWTTETVPVSEYTYTLSYDNGSLSVSPDTTEDGYGLILNAEGLEEGDVTLTIRLYNADGDLVVKDYLYFYVSDSGYYYLTADTSDGIVVLLGEDYDLADAGISLHYVSNDGDEEVSEDEYYLSVDDWEDYCFESKDDLTLTNRIHTDGTYAYVAAYSSDENNDWLAGTSISFDGLDYNSIELSLTDDNLNEYGYYIVYDYDQGVELSYSGENALPDDCTVEWSVYEDHQDIISVSGDIDSAVVTLLTDDSEYDGWWVGVYADIYYADNWIAGNEIWMEVVIPYTEYYTFENTTVALGEGLWYDAYIDCYVRSYKYPYGENTSVQLTDLTAVSQFEYTDDGEQLTDDVISLDGDSESGWGIDTNTYGYAIMQGTYTDLDGEEQTFEFNIYVDGEYYYLNYAYLEETDGRVQVDDTITIDTSLQRVYTNDDGGAESETIEDYLSEGFSLNYSDYDKDIISVKITNDGEDGPDRMLAVTGLSEGGTDLYITVTNADGEVVADTWLWIEVTQDYYVLTYESKTLPLGATVDMGNLESNDYVTYTLTHYYTNDEGGNVSEIISLTSDNSYIEIEGYDDGCLELVDGEGTQLTRTNTWETWANVHVKLYNEDSGDYDEVASCGVVFSELTYDVSLANDSLDGNWVIYAGIDMTVSYELSEDSDTIPDDAERIWAVQYWDDDEQEMLDVYEELATWTEDEDGTITISTYSYERDIRVSLQVMYGENEIIWAEEWISTRSEGSYINIWVEDGSLLYGESTYVYGTYGDDSAELTFSEVNIVSYDSWDDYESGTVSENNYATESQDEDGNCVIIANTDGNCGVVQVLVTYADPYSEETVEKAEAGTIWVGGDEIVFDYPDGQDFEINRPEDDNTIKILVDVYHVYTEQNTDGEWETATEDVDIHGLEYYDEYDDSVIEVSYSYEGNSLVFTVTGLEEGWTNFSFSILDENDNEQGYEWISISVNGKLDASIDAEDYTVEKEYGDEVFNLVDELKMEIVSDSDVYYTILEGGDVVEIDKDGNITIIGVGTATIKVYVEETNTYSYAKVNVTIEVGKADIILSGTDSWTKTYGDEAFALDVEADTSECELSYALADGSDTDVVSVDASTGVVTILKAGTATIMVSAEPNSDSSDFYNAAEKTVTVNVKKADATITGTASYDKYMTDSAFTLDTVLNHDETTLTYEVVANPQVVSVDENGLVTILEPGAAEIVVSAAETDNYKAATYVVGVTVIKATASITPATSTQTVTYGQSIVLSADNLGLTVVGDGTPNYTVTSGMDVLSISDSTAATLKAGTAVITVSMAATDKYYAADDVTITVTVNKADGTGSVTITGWVAGETANAPAAISATNGTDNVTYYYKVQGADDSTYTTTVPTTAGSYTVKAVFAATDNYNEVSATSNFTVLDMSGYVELDTNVDDLSDITLPTGWAWVSGQEILPGAINYVQAVNSSTSETITVPVALIPHITSNDTFTKGEDTSAVIKCSGELQYFKGLKVDGKEVAATSYTATHGSTILTFTQDYMNTLSVGAHTVTLTYETGDLDATLTVLEKSTTETESETTATESETTATESETETATEIATEIETETDTDTEETTETATTASGESETTSSDSVSTGDETPIATTLAVMLLAAALLIAGAAYRRMYGRRK
ncbi:MAG: hypothetical protein LIO99_06015 [Clostridiales bacterium]|nr:hypothetical protein [Clostridiales bacterium]